MKDRPIIRLPAAILILGCLLKAQERPAQRPAFPAPTKGAEPWTGSQEQKLWGLMTVWSEAKFAFPFFDRLPDLDWDKKVREAIPRVMGAGTLEEYYDVLREFAALLHDGHTAVMPPWMFVKPRHDQPPVELQAVEGRFFVAAAGDTEEIRRQRIYAGLEVLEIGDGVPVAKYLEENVLRFNSFGTPQADEAIGLMGLLDGLKDSRVALKVKDPDGAVREVTLARNSTDRDGSPFLWRWMRWFLSDPPIETRTIAPDIQYLRISSFGSEKVVQEFMKVLDGLDLQRTRGMILDVRFNSGGNSDFAYAIAGGLTDEPLKAAKWKSLSYVPAHRSWDRPAGWIEGGPAIVEPRRGNRYTGPLVVLTGPGTFSAAEDFLVPLQYSGRAVLVGEKTAGSTGNPIVVPLPGGGIFRVVSKRDMFPDGREFVGLGISPDVEALPTQRDLVQGADPVLRKGLEVIENWARYRKTPSYKPSRNPGLKHGDRHPKRLEPFPERVARYRRKAHRRHLFPVFLDALLTNRECPWPRIIVGSSANSLSSSTSPAGR